MLLLAATGLYKTYGLKTIFDHISVNIDSNDKIGLLGVNGTGKSTLLRILAGLAQADSGEIQTSNQLVMEYLPQHPDFDENATVLQQIFRGESPFMKVLRSYEQTLDALEHDPANQALTQQLLELSAQMDEQHAWQLESEAKAILNKLGIHDFSAKISSLSGGQRKRIALAGALIRPCNLLILDEPTNHLDNEAIEFLEQHLKAKNCALLMVTHDRYFLDRVTNRILELTNAQLYSYEGNYETFLELKTQREEADRRMQEKAHALYKQELAWMRKGAEARRTKQKARIERFYELEDSLTTQQEEKMDISLQHSRLGKKIIEIDHLRKTFGDKVCIDNLTYAVVRHDRIGIVGNNGLGKSTLLNLIPRFYDVTSGKVTVDGIDVRDMPQETLHSLLGYVPQKGILFSGSIASNLKFGGEQITDADMKKAAAIAQAAEFIDAKPEGYDSPIAQGGSNVSGGQKQRLSIARAIAKAPRIYLFDDSFSALDYKTDVTLRRALKAETGDATVIIVAQRISTVLHANQILVLDEGRLVGRGTHAQLMASCPEYQEIARSQLSQKELDLKDLNTGKEEK